MGINKKENYDGGREQRDAKELCNEISREKHVELKPPFRVELSNEKSETTRNKRQERMEGDRESRER